MKDETKTKKNKAGMRKAKLWTIGRKICAVLATAGLAATLWLVHYTLIVNPFFDPRAVLLLLMMASSAVFINMSIAIPQSYLIRTWWLRLLAGMGKWALTVILPIVFISMVSNSADKLTEKIARENLSPVVAYIEQEISLHGKPPVGILNEISKVDMLKNITYIPGKDHYVLFTSMSSWEFEGTKIYYIYPDGVWRSERNLLLEEGVNRNAKHFNEATAGLTKRVYMRNYKSGLWDEYK